MHAKEAREDEAEGREAKGNILTLSPKGQVSPPMRGVLFRQEMTGPETTSSCALAFYMAVVEREMLALGRMSA
jgi:hypothetical protein